MIAEEDRLDFYPSPARGSTSISDLDGRFTLQNVVRVLRELKGWDFWWSYNAIRWRWIGGALLGIATVKLDDISRACSSNHDEEGLKKVVRVWMDTCPYASWRWLIWRMDREAPTQGNMHDLADLMREFGEPTGVLKDPSLTVENVTTVLSNVQLSSIASCLKILQVEHGVTRPMGQLTHQISKEDYISSWLASPLASWEVLVGGLFLEDETEALELAKQYLKTTPDPSFTFANISAFLGGYLFDPALFDLPESSQEHIHQDSDIQESGQSSDSDESKPDELSHRRERDTIFRYYLSSHPAPSWRQLAYGLYTIGLYYIEESDLLSVPDYDMLWELKQKYLKEINLQELCVQVIASSLPSTDDVDSLPLPVALKSSIRSEL